MDTRTGEIRHFEPEEEIPDKWVLIPPVGTEVDIMFKQKLKGGVNSTRKRRGMVIEIQEGKPGRLVIEMLPMKRR